MQGRDDSTADSSRVQIWQRSNWHWYLKREICSLGPGEVFMAWQEVGLCLTIITSDGVCSEVGLASPHTKLCCNDKDRKNGQDIEVVMSLSSDGLPGAPQ